MRETSKCHDRRLATGEFDRYMRGIGIDIGAGPDALTPPNATVRAWDMEDGDAMLMASVPNETFDFAYSSHCLEHVRDVAIALRHWTRILKPGGWLYFVVPDYGLYEKYNWPSQFNPDHKSSFSLDLPRAKVKRNSHYHMTNDLVPLLKELGVAVEALRIEDDGFDYQKGFVDQTQMGAMAQICLIAQKRK